MFFWVLLAKSDEGRGTADGEEAEEEAEAEEEEGRGLWPPRSLSLCEIVSHRHPGWAGPETSEEGLAWAGWPGKPKGLLEAVGWPFSPGLGFARGTEVRVGRARRGDRCLHPQGRQVGLPATGGALPAPRSGASSWAQPG